MQKYSRLEEPFAFFRSLEPFDSIAHLVTLDIRDLIIVMTVKATHMVEA
jgi:hypothetical protein